MILIATALSVEAAPLLSSLKLKLLEAGSFSIYGNDRFRLIVTGVGKVAMAAGISYLYALSKDSPVAGFVNIGIAGHRLLPLGSALLAHKIIDLTLKKSYYPRIHFDGKWASGIVATVDKPEENFTEDVCYDMEASAFFSTALRFATAERIQVIKIISDNVLEPFSHLTKEKVRHLIEENLEMIHALFACLPNLTQQSKEVDFSGTRFTETQKMQFQSLVKRLQALDSTFVIEMDKTCSAKEMLQRYEKLLHDQLVL